MTDAPKAIFLSYASQDAAAAQRLAATLRAAGLEVWHDQSELRGGDEWDAAIRRQIRACALFVPVISSNTNARTEGYFRLEWKLAVDRSHLMASERAFLVPVIIDDIDEPSALVPDRFREVQWTRCAGGQVPDPLVARLRTLLLGAGDHGDARGNGDAHSATPMAPPTGNPPPRRGRRTGLAAVVALAVLCAAGAVAVWRLVLRPDAIRVVAVLPFDNATGDATNDYLSDGIAESLINRLSSLRHVQVISRTSSFALKGRKLAPADAARRLGADALVLGSLAQHGADIEVSAELVSAHDATQLWGAKFARHADDVLQVEADMAATIAAQLDRRLGREEQAQLSHAEAADPEAYRLYLKGREFLVGTQAEMDKSIDYFQQAVIRAPGYALAHAGLAEAYTTQAYLRASGRKEALASASAAATRAIELDPDLAEAHVALGDIRYLFQWDWRGAEDEYRRALALNPASSDAHQSLGAFLNGLIRLDEGLEHSREAARLDPLSVGPFHDIAINALLRGDYPLAAQGFRHTIEIDPDWVWGYIKLARTLALQKKCPEAMTQAGIAEDRIRGGEAPLSRSWLGITYALCGERTRARQKLDELHAIEKTQYVDPVTFATVHDALGETDEALTWYEKAFADHSPNMATARLVTVLSPQLAATPRFQAILSHMGLR